MHEYHLLAHLIEHAAAHCREHGIGKVSEVHIRKSCLFEDGVLQDAFATLAGGTQLAGAALVLDECPVEEECRSCRSMQSICCSDLIDHFFYCPSCGALGEVSTTHGLDLVGLMSGTGFEAVYVKGHCPKTDGRMSKCA